MKSNEVFELVHLVPKMDEVILDKTTPEFWHFWVKTFGKIHKTQDEKDYWEKCSFVFIGWLGAKEHTKELEQSNKNEEEKNVKNETN